MQKREEAERNTRRERCRRGRGGRRIVRVDSRVRPDREEAPKEAEILHGLRRGRPQAGGRAGGGAEEGAAGGGLRSRTSLPGGGTNVTMM